MRDLIENIKKNNYQFEDSKLVELGSEKSEVILDALSSKTSRDVFIQIYNSPSTISEIADELDGSVQNVKYHVEKLEKSGIIETKHINYSEKGNEMNVYQPTHEAIILLAGTNDSKEKIRDKLKPIGGVIIAIAFVSFMISQFVNNISKTIPVNTSTEKEVPSIDSAQNSENTTVEVTKNIETVSEHLAFGFLQVSPEIAVILSLFIGAIVGIGAYILTKNRQQIFRIIRSIL